MFPDEDSISDWSSDSCGWSEDEMGADLDIIASPLSCSSLASTTGSQETVRCVCEVEEENDFMLQVTIQNQRILKKKNFLSWIPQKNIKQHNTNNNRKLFLKLKTGVMATVNSALQSQE